MAETDANSAPAANRGFVRRDGEHFLLNGRRIYVAGANSYYQMIHRRTGHAGADEILDDPEDYLDSWNMLDDVQVATFTEGVRRLRDHAAKTLVTPFEQRGEKPF